MSSLYSISQMNQLGDTLERSGYMPADVTQLSGGDILANLLPLVRAYGKMVAVPQNLVDCDANPFITRRVVVNRARSPQEVLDTTGRKQYMAKEVVAGMPRGEGEEVEVIFFKVGRYISDGDLEKEYELCGLKPADPFSQAAVNEADPVFADEHPNVTHWKDVNGRWCYSAFFRWRGRRYVSVYRDGSDWHVDWWFTGLRK